MKRFMSLFAIVMTVACCSTALAQVPRQVAGITLGANIDQYTESIKKEAALPLRHMQYLSEIEIKPVEGFRTGYVVYGTCDEPGRIVRLKMKYERDDKEFFEDLLERFKKRFGEPQEYKGDVFRSFIAWKWSFQDENKNRISMILQHNSTDDEEYTSGNSLKMSATSLIEKESRCHESRHPEAKQEEQDLNQKKSRKKVDFETLIPR